MLHNLAEHNSVLSSFVRDMRSVEIQGDRMRFRKNLKRIGQVAAYEISKHLEYETQQVKTPLGNAEMSLMKRQPVLATILRAGLALHEGLLDYFDGADNAYISAYRKHDESGNFTIELEYVSCPEIDDRLLIISDPMLATGSSMVATVEKLLAIGKPASVHIVSAIASTSGVEKVQQGLPGVHIWTAALDSELDERGYIIPGLGDAGDLSFGPKIQS